MLLHDEAIRDRLYSGNGRRGRLSMAFLSSHQQSDRKMTLVSLLRRHNVDSVERSEQMRLITVLLVLVVLVGCIPSGDPAYPSGAGKSPGLSSVTAACKYGVAQAKDASGVIKARCRTWTEYQSLKVRALWDSTAKAVVKELNYAWEKDRERIKAPPCKWVQQTPIGPVCHR